MTNEQAYLKPTSVTEALAMAAAAGGDFRYVAGGTDLMPARFQGNDRSTTLIDITGLDALRGIVRQDGMLRIGSLVTLEELAGDTEVETAFPALAEAARSAASPVLRLTATIGGNILCENRCSFYNQSAWWRDAIGLCLKCDGTVCIATGGTRKCFSRFVSDTAPVLIALEARLVIRDAGGDREMALENLYTGDGIRPHHLEPGAIVQHILVPVSAPRRCSFLKLRPRESVDFTSLTTAVSVSGSGNVRLVVGGADPMPVVVTGTAEEASRLLKRAMKKPRVVDNDIYTRRYRKDMIGVFLRRGLEAVGLPVPEETG